MAQNHESRRSNCPINAALETFGDRWSLLIIRDLMFYGRRTYREFLEAKEGIATNVLASRLKSLKASGIITTRPDPSDGRKQLYALTRKGIDLAPILIGLVAWASRYERTSLPPALKRRMQEEPNELVADIVRRWGDSQP